MQLNFDTRLLDSVKSDGGNNVAHDCGNNLVADPPSIAIPAAAMDVVLMPDESIIIAKYSMVDENGTKRKYARTRNGREIPYFTDEEFAAWCELHPYDPEL